MLRVLTRLALATLLCTGCGQAPERAPAAGTDSRSSNGSDSLDPASADDGSCVGTEVAARQLPVDLFAAVDGSSSMDEATFTGVSKWYATKAAFRDFIQHAPAGMALGLSLFPLAGDDAASCASQQYRDAALPMQDITQMAGNALAQLEATTPHGQTPTAPALTAALDLASSYALSHPERSVVVVLATDGLPTTCAPTDAAALAQLAKEALDGPAHVRTLVVVPRALSGADISSFDRVAVSGGTGHLLTIDPHADFSEQLQHALAAVATREIACDLGLPEAPRGQRLDYEAVNVVLQGTDGSRATLPRVSGPSSCAAGGGWYYDVDPALGAPSRLDMCKASCDRASAASAEKLQVELGCRTVVR